VGGYDVVIVIITASVFNVPRISCSVILFLYDVALRILYTDTPIYRCKLFFVPDELITCS
jgi:hypothetical protein